MILLIIKLGDIPNLLNAVIRLPMTGFVRSGRSTAPPQRHNTAAPLRRSAAVLKLYYTCNKIYIELVNYEIF